MIHSKNMTRRAWPASLFDCDQAFNQRDRKLNASVTNPKSPTSAVYIVRSAGVTRSLSISLELRLAVTYCKILRGP